MAGGRGAIRFAFGKALATEVSGITVSSVRQRGIEIPEAGSGFGPIVGEGFAVWVPVEGACGLEFVACGVRMAGACTIFACAVPAGVVPWRSITISTRLFKERPSAEALEAIG